VAWRFRLILSGCVLAGAVVLTGVSTKATDVRSVFVIAMENHNWTQPANQFTGNIQQIYQNLSAPYINSLVDGSAAISDQVAYAAAYHNVLATPTGANPHIHPSEPNYLWAEAGTNFGVLNDNSPFGTGGTNQDTTQHFTTLLTQAGRSWKGWGRSWAMRSTRPTCRTCSSPAGCTRRRKRSSGPLDLLTGCETVAVADSAATNSARTQKDLHRIGVSSPAWMTSMSG
jgi:hypothetical protein